MAIIMELFLHLFELDWFIDRFIVLDIHYQWVRLFCFY